MYGSDSCWRKYFLGVFFEIILKKTKSLNFFQKKPCPVSILTRSKHLIWPSASIVTAPRKVDVQVIVVTGLNVITVQNKTQFF